MRALLLHHIGSLGGKYWLLPALMAISAIVVSFAIVAIDRQLGSEWIEHLPVLYANESAGALALLSTIAGSMITVAGVTFSITIAALATSAATFRPRLIGNLMQDRGNQVTLGTFIGGYQSPHQDVLYIVNRLVEVAGRALSPGMNDIFTATNAMGRLGGGLANLAGRAVTENRRWQPRMRARSRTFNETADSVFDQLRFYVAADRNAVVHLMRVLAPVGGDTTALERRAILLTHAKALRHAASQAIAHPRNVEPIEAVYGDCVASLSAPRVGAQAATGATG